MNKTITKIIDWTLISIMITLLVYVIIQRQEIITHCDITKETLQQIKWNMTI